MSSTTAVGPQADGHPTPTEHRSAANQKAIRARRRREARFGWAFVAPFAVLFVIVFIVPIIVSVQQSFYTTTAGGGLYGGGEQTTSFAGLDNYVAVVTNERFWAGIGRVLLFGAFQIPVMIIVALVLALLVDSFLVKRVTVFRLGYFLPYAIPGVIAAMIWMYLYSPQFSPIVKLTGIDFFDQNIILASMANMTTWTFTGYNMLIFLAALQAIPTELYEAARLDGASGLQVAPRITVPLVAGAALLTVLLSIVGTIQLFNEPTIMATSQAWMGKDYTPMMMAYNTMMASPGDPHGASAISIVMALIAGLLACVYAIVQRKTASN